MTLKLKNQCWFANPILILAKFCYRLLKLLLDFVKVISYKKQLRSWDSHFIEVVWIIRMLDYYRLRFHSELHLLLCTIEAISWSTTVAINFIIHTMHMDIYTYIYIYLLTSFNGHTTIPLYSCNYIQGHINNALVMMIFLCIMATDKHFLSLLENWSQNY